MKPPGQEEHIACMDFRAPMPDYGLKINGRVGWAARRPRREQDHTVLLTAAFMSGKAWGAAAGDYQICRQSVSI